MTILLGILLVFVSSECTQQFAALQTATDEYIECENQASELQAASDYLAEQVRLFVVTGQREYMDLYFEEKDVTRRQEKAFAYLEQEFDGTTSLESLKTALNSTKNLSYADRYAMRLAADAYIADGGKLAGGHPGGDAARERPADDRQREDSQGTAAGLQRAYQTLHGEHSTTMLRPAPKA